jgi:hypothetical protein
VTAYILPDDDSGRIITFDAILDEFHEDVSEVTSHPVEEGVNVSDHVRQLPGHFSLTADTTNTPIVENPFTQRGELSSIEMRVPQYTIPVEPTPGALYRAGLQAISSAVGGLFGDTRKANVLTFSEPFNAIRETYEILRELQENAVLLQILTSLRDYEDMLLVRVAAPRGGGDAGVSFGLDVRSIRVIESGQVASPPVPADDVPGGKPLENKGGQGAKPPPTGEDEGKGGSIAYNLLAGQGLI